MFLEQLLNIFIIIVVIISLIWFLLPFAVFGIKKRLDKLIEQNREIINLLKKISIEKRDRDRSKKE